MTITFLIFCVSIAWLLTRATRESKAQEQRTLNKIEDLESQARLYPERSELFNAEILLLKSHLPKKKLDNAPTELITSEYTKWIGVIVLIIALLAICILSK